MYQTTHTFHSDSVMPFIGNPKAAETLGLLDRDEFFVESIVSHAGNPSHITSLKFLVHWSGYPTDSDSYD